MSQLCLYLQQLSFSCGCHFHLCLAIIKVIVQHKGQRFDVPPHVQVSLTIIMKSQLPKKENGPGVERISIFCEFSKTTAFYEFQCQPFRSVFLTFWKQNRGIFWNLRNSNDRKWRRFCCPAPSPPEWDHIELCEPKTTSVRCRLSNQPNKTAGSLLRARPRKIGHGETMRPPPRNNLI